MEARVWRGTKGRFDPFQQFEQGTLTLDSETLTFRGDDGSVVSGRLSELELGFPLSMAGGGFTMTVGGARSYVWFYDPFAGRGTLLTRFKLRKAQLEGGTAWLAGVRKARPWLKTLRAATH
jgi:hypothetical protein